AVRPRPGSNAMRTPTVAGNGHPPAAVRKRATPEGRRRRPWSPLAGAGVAAEVRQAAHAPRAVTTTTVATTPTPTIRTSTSRPGSGFAMRARPVGNAGETTTATTLATT